MWLRELWSKLRRIFEPRVKGKLQKAVYVRVKREEMRINHPNKPAYSLGYLAIIDEMVTQIMI